MRVGVFPVSLCRGTLCSGFLGSFMPVSSRGGGYSQLGGGVLSSAQRSLSVNPGVKSVKPSTPLCTNSVTSAVYS